jgi:hypothetical protein
VKPALAGCSFYAFAGTRFSMRGFDCTAPATGPLPPARDMHRNGRASFRNISAYKQIQRVGCTQSGPSAFAYAQFLPRLRRAAQLLNK